MTKNQKPSKLKEVTLFLIKGLIVLILALLPGVFVVVKLDPYMFLGLQPEPHIYVPNERFQIPGMARHEDYEIAVLGTSMIENFSDSYLSEKFGATALRLPINASYVTEQIKVLDIAKKYRNVKMVLWAIDYRTIDINAGDVYSKNVNFPDYLYDENPINDWKYIVNHNNLYLALKQYRMRKTGLNPFEYMTYNREVINSWNWKRTGKDLIMKDYKDLYEGSKSVYDKLNGLPLDVVKNTVDQTLLKAIERYPDIEFKLFFAPKSILWFKLLDQTGLLEKKLEALTYVVDRVSAYPNVEIYNFQNIYEITENLDLYLDITHYNKTGNLYMADSMAEKKHLTDPDSFRKDCAELLSRVRSDEINELAESALK